VTRRGEPAEWGGPMPRAESWRMLRFLAVVATVLILAAHIGTWRG